ncbi:MAG TPA: hypothetical protein ENK57_00935 [Polyangiaceae bacterium]|nr:hypothetical protein [Polyangiaceae bacterium]
MTGSAYRGWPPDLNPSNRPVRTRMPGGVGGDRQDISCRPYPDSMGRYERGVDGRALDDGVSFARRSSGSSWCRARPTLRFVDHATCHLERDRHRRDRHLRGGGGQRVFSARKPQRGVLRAQ